MSGDSINYGSVKSSIVSSKRNVKELSRSSLKEGIQDDDAIWNRKKGIELHDRSSIRIDMNKYKSSNVLNPDSDIQPKRRYYKRNSQISSAEGIHIKRLDTIEDKETPYANEKLTTIRLKADILKENNNFIKVIRKKDLNSYFHRNEYFQNTE